MTFALLNIKVAVKQWERKPMYLHEAIGEGKLEDGRKFTVDTTVPDHSLLITIDGMPYQVDIKDIIGGIAEATV